MKNIAKISKLEISDKKKIEKNLYKKNRDVKKKGLIYFFNFLLSRRVFMEIYTKTESKSQVMEYKIQFY